MDTADMGPVPLAAAHRHMSPKLQELESRIYGPDKCANDVMQALREYEWWVPMLTMYTTAEILTEIREVSITAAVGWHYLRYWKMLEFPFIAARAIDHIRRRPDAPLAVLDNMYIIAEREWSAAFTQGRPTLGEICPGAAIPSGQLTQFRERRSRDLFASGEFTSLGTTTPNNSNLPF